MQFIDTLTSLPHVTLVAVVYRGRLTGAFLQFGNAGVLWAVGVGRA
jgi:hypothetical protein